MTLGASLRETLVFVTGRMRPPPARVLEIGAGGGELARELGALGYEVTAIDESADAVEAARARGVRAIRSRWPAWSAGGARFDHVLFTRSLHHVENLHAAIERATDVLAPNGAILIEDFAFHEADDDTVRWFASLARSVAPRRPGEAWTTSFAGRIAAADDPVAAWFQDAHHIHPFARIRKALEESAVITFEDAPPYLYRYVERAGGVDTGERALREETAAAARGAIATIGRRVVAEPAEPEGT